MASVLNEPGVAVARFSVERYHHLVASGILTEDDRFELIEGVLVDAMTEGPAHAWLISEIANLMATMLDRERWRIRVQHPITTADSEPEPDVAIVKAQRYDTAHPTAPDIAVVIEVADTSLLRDRTTKARVYAAAGITRYVIINLAARTVEVYTDPVSDPEPRYSTMRTLTSGPVDLGPITLDAADMTGQ